MSLVQLYPHVNPESTELAKRLITIGLAAAITAALSGCGVSLGQSAWGTRDFMVEHNNKLRVLQAVADENKASAESKPMDNYTMAERAKLSEMIRRY